MADCGWPQFSAAKVLDYARRSRAVICLNRSLKEFEVASLVTVPSDIDVVENEGVYVASAGCPITYPLRVKLDHQQRIVEVSRPW